MLLTHKKKQIKLYYQENLKTKLLLLKLMIKIFSIKTIFAQPAHRSSLRLFVSHGINHLIFHLSLRVGCVLCSWCCVWFWSLSLPYCRSAAGLLTRTPAPVLRRPSPRRAQAPPRSRHRLVLRAASTGFERAPLSTRATRTEGARARISLCLRI